MEKIIQAFRGYFNNKVEIPDVLNKKGHLADDGWTIYYVILKDDTGKICLDFTAYSRFTNFRHHRISCDGDISWLKCYKDEYSYDPDIPGDKELKEKEYYEYNRQVSKILRDKGLENY